LTEAVEGLGMHATEHAAATGKAIGAGVRQVGPSAESVGRDAAFRHELVDQELYHRAFGLDQRRHSKYSCDMQCCDIHFTNHSICSCTGNSYNEIWGTHPQRVPGGVCALAHGSAGWSHE